jgi:hypothetical protein
LFKVKLMIVKIRAQDLGPQAVPEGEYVLLEFSPSPGKTNC